MKKKKLRRGVGERRTRWRKKWDQYYWNITQDIRCRLLLWTHDKKANPERLHKVMNLPFCHSPLFICENRMMYRMFFSLFSWPFWWAEWVSNFTLARYQRHDYEITAFSFRSFIERKRKIGNEWCSSKSCGVKMKLLLNSSNYISSRQHQRQSGEINLEYKLRIFLIHPTLIYVINWNRVELIHCFHLMSEFVISWSRWNERYRSLVREHMQRSSII